MYCKFLILYFSAGFILFFNCIVQVIDHIKGGKCENVSLPVIFLHHKNLAFEQGFVDFISTVPNKEADILTVKQSESHNS